MAATDWPIHRLRQPMKMSAFYKFFRKSTLQFGVFALSSYRGAFLYQHKNTTNEVTVFDRTSDTELSQNGILKPSTTPEQNSPEPDREVNKTKQTAVSTSRRGSENLDPNAEAGKGVSKLKGVSRLPVLAKSLQPAVNDISQQNKWEQRPLTGKAQKKKICTKPIPFNLSQSRTRSQRSTEVSGGKTPLTPGRLTPGGKLRSHNAATPSVFKTAHKTQSVSIDGHPPKAETLSHETRSSSDLSSRLGNITLVQSKLSEDSGLSHLCKTSLSKVGVGSGGQAQKDKNSIQIVQSSHAGTKAMHNVLSCEGSSARGAQCVMPRLSTYPPGPGSSNNLAQRVSVKMSQREIVSGTGNTGAFSPDPSALRSILQNDATRIVESVGATPRISTCPAGRQTSFYSAQRVPVKKPLTADSADKVTGSTVSFSPDPSALCSILQNEGVRVGTQGGATPRVSTCPTGRGTSIYSAQRVPVKKTKAEATEASHCPNRTPGRTWTPQRVPNTKPQSMRRLLTAQKMSRFRDSPGLNGPQDPSTELLMQQVEDVVQRLFEDPDLTDKSDVSSQQLLTTSTNRQTIEPVTNKKNSDANHRHTVDEGKKAAQPFIQAAHRSSVIVFSSSQRLCGSDRPLQTAVTEVPLQLCVDSVISQNALQSDQNGHLDATKHINNTQHQIKVSAFRRRHTPLEEMILDEECSTYTSRPLSCPLKPRSGNPVATILLFQDSTCFLPIGLSSPIRLSPVPGSSIRA